MRDADYRLKQRVVLAMLGTTLDKMSRKDITKRTQVRGTTDSIRAGTAYVMASRAIETVVEMVTKGEISVIIPEPKDQNEDW